METSALNMNSLSQQLIGNEISLAQWQSGMMQQIKLSHTAAASSANGGWAQMTQSDWGFAGQLIRRQYEHLDRFASQIANGEQALNGQVLFRTDLYGQAARGTYESQRQRLEIGNGMRFERRLRENDGSNCIDCIAAADEGWQPVGTLPIIGDSACLTNCRCTFVYSETNPDEGEE